MQKNKLHASINIVGMAVAFTCSILLLVMVYNEFSFDSFHKNKNHLFKLYNFGNAPEGLDVSVGMAYPAASTVKLENIGIEKATRIRNRGREIRYKDKMLEQSIILVDDDFFSMFSFPIIKGVQKHPLASENDVVLSEKTSNSLFGIEKPIGKSVEIKVGGQWKSLVVSAIIKEAPLNSSIKYSVLARTEIDPDFAALKNDWHSENHSVYVQLSANATEASVNRQLLNINKKYHTVEDDFLKKKGYKPDANGN